MQKSLKSNKGGGIRIENCFITDLEGAYNINLAQGSGRLEKITPTNSESTHHEDFSNTKNNSNPLTFKTLDCIVLKHHFEPNFIKIDTDGFDFKVLRSAQQTLKESQSLVLFEWDMFHLQAQNEDPLSIFSYLESLGYHKALIFDNFGTPLCVAKLSDIQNLKLLLDYTLYSDKNIYYYDVLLFPENSPFEPYECAKFINSTPDS
ncbi:FkbM family methyltransferase [Helicobacter himalayensis]|uniref:FkbM family methyltransferase n=1 Tax=Helicobacter himalayensis TaxID=1591088 RepID=UPI0009ECD646|nr:FkbM family methyltransferase [Helicobacter himalayensis]